MKRDREQPPLGRRLTQLRQSRYLTQHALAFRAGLSQAVVQGIEQGVRQDPRMTTLVKLAAAFGITVDDLLPKEKTVCHEVTMEDDS